MVQHYNNQYISNSDVVYIYDQENMSTIYVLIKVGGRQQVY